jgi:hypothetical protein
MWTVRGGTFKSKRVDTCQNINIFAHILLRMCFNNLLNGCPWIKLLAARHDELGVRQLRTDCLGKLNNNPGGFVDHKLSALSR